MRKAMRIKVPWDKPKKKVKVDSTTGSFLMEIQKMSKQKKKHKRK